MASTTASPATITTTAITTITTTTSTDALYRLLAWLSPAYPVGAYTYSHGLETVVEDGAVRGRDDLVAYVTAALRDGAGRVDGALLAAAHRAMAQGRAKGLDAAAELGAAWRGTAETALEAEAQGTAFLSVTLAAWPEPRLAVFAARHPRRIVHAVAFGAAAAAHGVALPQAAFGYLAAFAANLVSAGVRLVPLGQTDGQKATAALLPVVAAAADAALGADLESLGTSSPALDLFSIRHETQYTRLFRS